METTTLSEMNNERQVICNNEKNDESTKSKFEKLSNFTCDGYVDPKNSTNITVRTKATSEKHNLDDIAVHEEETNKNDDKDNLNHLHDVKQQKFQTASLRRSRRISSSAYRRKPLIFALNVNRVIVKVNQKIELVIDCDNRKNNFNEIKLNNFSQKIKNLKQVASNVSEAYESNSISSSNVLRRSRRLSLDLPSPSQMILSPASKKDNRNNVNSSKKPENLKPAAVATYTSKENEIKNEVSRSSERPLRRSRRLSLDPPLSIHSHLASSSNKPADASNISKESTINNAVNLSPKRPLRRSRRLSLEPPLPLETSVKTSLSFDVSKRKGGRRKKRKKSIVLDPNRIIPVLPILQPEQSILNPPSYHSHSSSPINSESHECQQHQPLKKVKHNRSVVFHSPRAAFYKIQSFPGEFEVMQKETVKSLFSIGPNTAEQKNNELETIKSKNNEINSLISDELVQPLDSSKKEIASFDDLSSVRNTSSQHNIDENSCQYNQNSSKQIEEEEQSIGHRIQNNHETEVMKQYEAAELGKSNLFLTLFRLFEQLIIRLDVKNNFLSKNFFMYTKHELIKH